MTGPGTQDDARVQELIEALIENPKNEEAEREFWREFCNLPGWFLLSNPEDARKAIQAGQPEIRVQMFQDGERTFIPIFTSPERAQGVVEGQSIAAARMPPETALTYMCGFRGRIDGFIVNPMPGKVSGFGHRLPDLCAFFRHERGFLPAGAIHCAVDHARNTKHPAAFQMVHEIVAGLDKIYAGTKDNGFAFVADGDNLWLSIYSDAGIATRACEQHEGLQLIEGTPAQLVDRVERAMTESEGRIKGAVLNHPENGIALDHRLLVKVLEAKGK
ncbi:MAG: SseB family protein [Phycisphaerales bacterium JB064]